jgi:CubicO group peptidase (beta-lactamase class C family)
MTKPIKAVAALRLVEQGRIDLDGSIEPWLPELAGRRVLTRPGAPLDQTVPAARPITLRHLLTNTAGWGMILQPSPLQDAMAANGTEADVHPVSFGPEEWLARMADLPLAFQPGEGWRYHHSFGVLGILISRITGGPLSDHLAEDLFGPLGMTDTGFTVPAEKLGRLPAGYQDAGDLVEVEPAGAGFYADPPFDLSHAELVSTARDYHRFVRAVLDGSLISDQHRRLMLTDQVPASAKTADSFFPGFWDEAGWGLGVCVQPSGRWGWSGGLGTDFWVDPDGTIGILLTQVELGGRMEALLREFGER